MQSEGFYVNDTIGNRTRDLPACNAVSQPNAPPGVPYLQAIASIFVQNSLGVNRYRVSFLRVKLHLASRLKKV